MMEGLRRTLAATCLALAVAPAVGLAATKPPDTKLRTKGDQASVGSSTYAWSFPPGSPGPFKGCGTVHADGVYSYEPILSVRHNQAKTTMIFFRDRKPVVTRFRAHSTLDDNGSPKGRGRHVKNGVLPRRVDGEITSWKVLFRADAGRRPFMDMHVSFPIRQVNGCDEGGGAFYSFGIERRAGR